MGGFPRLIIMQRTNLDLSSARARQLALPDTERGIGPRVGSRQLKQLKARVTTW
jgi:hypothetical protein